MEPNIWVILLEQLELLGEIVLVSDQDLDKFESKKGFVLPVSFREFAKVFGPGRLTGLVEVDFAAPGNQEWGRSLDMYQLNDFIAATPDAEVEEKYADPAFFRNAICFASWDKGWFVWERRKRLGDANDELPVYLINNAHKILRVAPSFPSFILKSFLMNGVPGYYPTQNGLFQFEAGIDVA